MSLVLAEILPDRDVADVLRSVESVARASGGEFIEAQVTGSKDRVFAIVEGVAPADLRTALGAAGLNVDDVASVRLVGADLAAIKADRPASGYLVEWDLPSGLTMDAYLARKKEKSPLYAQVPRPRSSAPTCVRTWSSACASMTHPTRTPSAALVTW